MNRQLLGLVIVVILVVSGCGGLTRALASSSPSVYSDAGVTTAQTQRADRAANAMAQVWSDAGVLAGRGAGSEASRDSFDGAWSDAGVAVRRIEQRGQADVYSDVGTAHGR